jgi:membrane-associated protease RseP (regulator of RpoE activity)
LYSKRREDITDTVIQKRLKKDKWAKFHKLLIYKQKKKLISEDELKSIQDDLLKKGLYTQAEESDKNYYLRVISSDTKKKSNQIFVPILLFLLTIVTTAITGAQLTMKEPFGSWGNFSNGFKYSFALLTILFVHEMGHYLYARYYKINVTLPYFIPFYFPLMFSFGTFGAFIRLREPIPDKKALFDIGIAGPFAGFVASIIFLIIGLNNIQSEAAVMEYISSIHPITEDTTGVLTFGGNLLFDFILKLSGKTYIPMHEVYHFPFIVAAWFGLLITSLNLMPIGQLDGGHITHAMFGKKSSFIAIAGFVGIIVLNILLISRFNSYVYILWPLLILIFIKFKHPPTLDDTVSIGPVRKFLGYLAYIIFIASFSPMPVYFQ